MAKSVREAAMDSLARREHGSRELRRKLVDKGYAPDEVVETLELLCREGLLSDERFTEAFLHSRLNRGSGPRKIAAELQQRGIDDSLISQFLDERDRNWYARASEARQKRFGPGLPDDFKEKARQARFLQQRGFSSEQVRFALQDDALIN